MDSQNDAGYSKPEPLLMLNHSGCWRGLRQYPSYDPVLSTTETDFLNWVDDAAIPAVLAEPSAVRLTLAIADKAISQTKTNEQAFRAQPDSVSDWVSLIERAEPVIDQPWRSLSRSMEEHSGHSPVGQTFS